MLSGYMWSPAATPLVAGLAGELRQRYVALIQRAYATIMAAQLGAYLGVGQTEALQSAFSMTHAVSCHTLQLSFTAAAVEPMLLI